MCVPSTFSPAKVSAQFTLIDLTRRLIRDTLLSPSSRNEKVILTIIIIMEELCTTWLLFGSW